MNPSTNRVHESQDIIWLKRMCFNEKKPAQEIIIDPVVIEMIPKNPIPNEGYVEARKGEEENKTTNEEEQTSNKIGNDELDTDVKRARKRLEITRLGKTIKKPRHLIDEISEDFPNYNILLSKAEQRYYDAMKDMKEEEFQ